MNEFYKARIEWDRGACIERIWNAIYTATDYLDKLTYSDNLGTADQLETLGELMSELSDAISYASIAANKIRSDAKR